jgi:hypothetical protein
MDTTMVPSVSMKGPVRAERAQLNTVPVAKLLRLLANHLIVDECAVSAIQVGNPVAAGLPTDGPVLSGDFSLVNDDVVARSPAYYDDSLGEEDSVATIGPALDLQGRGCAL